MYKHILISTDGSDVAGRGLEQGLSLAKSLGAKVTLITVTERFPVYAGAEFAMTDATLADYAAGKKQLASAALAAAKQSADRLGVAVETLHVPNAYPADAIVETAKSHHCDLIAMSSHGRRGLGRLMLGSVTSEVLANSPVPVLVVR